MRILVLNGPNLNLLGTRETDIYGLKTYHDLINFVKRAGKRHGFSIDIRQTNHEGVLLDWLHESADHRFAGVLLNAGAFSHTSYALYDAVKALRVPVIAVHLSDITRREPFRRQDVIAPACLTTCAGAGYSSYEHALIRLKEELSK